MRSRCSSPANPGWLVLLLKCPRLSWQSQTLTLKTVKQSDVEPCDEMRPKASTFSLVSCVSSEKNERSLLLNPPTDSCNLNPVADPYNWDPSVYTCTWHSLADPYHLDPPAKPYNLDQSVYPDNWDPPAAPLYNLNPPADHHNMNSLGITLITWIH